MFDDYSIAGASLPHDLDDTAILLDEDISPTSSRAGTPSPVEMNVNDALPPNPDMITELSSRFKQQSLGARTQQQLGPMEPADLLPPTLAIESPLLPLRSSSRRRSSSLLVWQQRQSMTRRQCSPAYLAQISKLAGELTSSRDLNLCYNATHPSSADHDRPPLSPTSNPSSCCSSSSFGSTPTSSGSEDAGFGVLGRPSRRVLPSKVDKCSRRKSKVEALERKQALVLKNVRVRRSSNRLRAGALG
ncbi:MAG: hypothetical protein Q9193_004861 [Seirophora villosa]